MIHVLMLFAAIGPGQFDDHGPPPPVYRQLSDDIVRNGYRRVGVLPRFICREGGREVLGGSIGPQADHMAEGLEEALVNIADGKFRVVDGRQMRQAFQKLSLQDLGRRETLRQVAGKVGGLDGLIVCTVTDHRGKLDPSDNPHLNIKARLIDVRDSSVSAVRSEDTRLTLADAAYMGESWELRRWSGGRLLIVGLKPTEGGLGSGNGLYGASKLYQSVHYPLIRRDRPHPLLDANCPYRMSVRVDGEDRRLVRVGNRLYLALDPGETYSIGVASRSTRDAYLCLFVDGINVLGKQRQHPTGAKFWYLKPQGEFRFAGWTTGRQGRYTQEAFIITPQDDTVAVGQGFGLQLGMMTAVFYTVGMNGFPKAPEVYASMGVGSFGTGAGAMSSIQLEERRGPQPGLTLAAMTVYYTTSSKLEQLRRGGGR